jgi:hypothetical protein
LTRHSPSPYRTKKKTKKNDVIDADQSTEFSLCTQKVFSIFQPTSQLGLMNLPTFLCSVCGRKVRDDYEVSCTGDVKRNVDKAPWCCGKQMTEVIDD